jgi:hypothetical protein
MAANNNQNKHLRFSVFFARVSRKSPRSWALGQGLLNKAPEKPGRETCDHYECSRIGDPYNGHNPSPSPCRLATSTLRAGVSSNGDLSIEPKREREGILTMNSPRLLVSYVPKVLLDVMFHTLLSRGGYRAASAKRKSRTIKDMHPSGISLQATGLAETGYPLHRL